MIDFCLGVCIFFGFNWASFFNKGICINLYILTFSILPLFHSQPNKNEGNYNLFYPPTFPSSHHFLSSHFSTPPIKQTLRFYLSFHHLVPTPSNPQNFFLISKNDIYTKGNSMHEEHRANRENTRKGKQREI